MDAKKRSSMKAAAIINLVAIVCALLFFVISLVSSVVAGSESNRVVGYSFEIETPDGISNVGTIAGVGHDLIYVNSEIITLTLIIFNKLHNTDYYEIDHDNQRVLMTEKGYKYFLEERNKWSQNLSDYYIIASSGQYRVLSVDNSALPNKLRCFNDDGIYEVELIAENISYFRQNSGGPQWGGEFYVYDEALLEVSNTRSNYNIDVSSNLTGNNNEHVDSAVSTVTMPSILSERDYEEYVGKIVKLPGNSRNYRIVEYNESLIFLKEKYSEKIGVCWNFLWQPSFWNYDVSSRIVVDDSCVSLLRLNGDSPYTIDDFVDSYSPWRVNIGGVDYAVETSDYQKNYFTVRAESGSSTSYSVRFNKEMIADISLTEKRIYVYEEKVNWFNRIGMSDSTSAGSGQDVAEATCEWSGYTCHLYNSSVDYTVLGKNDKLLFVNYDGVTSIVGNVLDSTAKYTVNTSTNTINLTSRGLVDMETSSVRELVGSSVIVGRRSFDVTACDTSVMPNLLTVKEVDSDETCSVKVISTMIIEFSKSYGMSFITVDEENFNKLNGINSENGGSSYLIISGADFVIGVSTYLLPISIIVGLIFTCMLLRKPKNDKTRFLGSTITAFVCDVIMIVSLILIEIFMGQVTGSSNSKFQFLLTFSLLFAFPAAIIYINTFCVGNPKKVKVIRPVRSPAVMKEYQLDDEIREICKLYKTGVLTKEELNKIIIKKLRAEA